MIAGYTCGCHTSMKNTDETSGHKTATTISSFSEWMLWVIIFTNTAIDIVTYITTDTCVVIAIIGTFIKLLVETICNMVNKVCWRDQSISIVTRSRKPATIPKSPPTPEVVITTPRQQPAITGWLRNPCFPLNQFVTFNSCCCKYSNR